jgi:hypothetical protein
LFPHPDYWQLSDWLNTGHYYSSHWQFPATRRHFIIKCILLMFFTVLQALTTGYSDQTLPLYFRITYLTVTGAMTMFNNATLTVLTASPDHNNDDGDFTGNLFHDRTSSAVLHSTVFYCCVLLLCSTAVFYCCVLLLCSTADYMYTAVFYC